MVGWSITTGRPIPGKVPRKVAQKGSTSGRQANQSPRRTRSSKVHQPQAPASRVPQALPDKSSSGSSIGSDDSIMREIDEVPEVPSSEEEGNSSPAVKVLPRDPRTSPSFAGSGARSPPISFEDVAEDVATAAVIKVVEDSPTSPSDLNPPPQPADDPVIQPGAPLPQQKGKRVAPGAEEGPESKKLRAQRDSSFMLGRILAMAKVYTPPGNQNPPTTASLLALTMSVASPVEPVAHPEAEGSPGVNIIGGDEIPGRGSPIQSPLRAEPDTFSQEFNKLQEEVASDREALGQVSPTPAFSIGPESSTPIPVPTSPQASTSVLPSDSATAGRRQDFQIHGLAGCPLEALNSLVTPDYSPLFGELPVEGYAEQLTGKILQFAVDVATSWKSLREPEQDQREAIQSLQARVKELEEESRGQRRALAESEKHRLRLQKLSELQESTLQSTLTSCERMVHDMEILEGNLSEAQARLKGALSEKAKLEATLGVELQSSGSLRATVQSLQAENSELKSELQSTRAARDRALIDNEKLAEERNQALSEKGIALTARDRVTSELEQAIADKKQALDEQTSAYQERREAVERMEELHLQVVELTRELSQVPELRDTSWAVGFNWGFEHLRGVARSAPPGDESFKDLDISTIQIPDEALETMAKLGVDQFPHVTDWSPKTSKPSPAGNSESGSTSSSSREEAPSSSRPGHPG
ncbi:uncharacterized protein LOC133875613 [Alnus glutinosa]|uniref:uncharacterized protein LOC133875613 n=1 Tax=Alnus glutinosa TaxID=3517 RepID=UPI002D7A1F30|nr:uncharacterized protein LOC133875613 [Alnus glutinosa]